MIGDDKITLVFLSVVFAIVIGLGVKLVFFGGCDELPKECYFEVWDNSTRPMRGVILPNYNCTDMVNVCMHLDSRMPRCGSLDSANCYDGFMPALECRFINGTVLGFERPDVCECIVVGNRGA